MVAVIVVVTNSFYEHQGLQHHDQQCLPFDVFSPGELLTLLEQLTLLEDIPPRKRQQAKQDAVSLYDIKAIERALSQ